MGHDLIFALNNSVSNGWILWYIKLCLKKMGGDKKTIGTNSQKVQAECASEGTTRGRFAKGFPQEESWKRGLVEQGESGQGECSDVCL